MYFFVNCIICVITESSKLSNDVENILKSIASMLDEDENKEKLAQVNNLHTYK